MASPQKEDGFTPIANELVEAFLLARLKEYERLIVLALWRKTYGWSKKWDWVSHSQFEQLTGIARKHVVRTVTSLKQRRLILTSGKKLSVNKNWEEWDVEWRVVPLEGLGSPPTGTSTSPPTGTHKRKKATIQKQGDSNESGVNNKTNMPFNKYADDYLEDDLQIDPDHKPKVRKKERKVSDDIQAVFNLFKNPAKINWGKRELERDAAQALFETYGLEKLATRMKRIEAEKQKKDPYFPEVNTPSQLLDKMPNVERYLNI